MKKILVWISLFFLTFWVSAESITGKDSLLNVVQEELKKQEVEFVVVEFYGNFCEPCKREIPKWEKLKNEYGKKLSIIFVVLPSGDGSFEILDEEDRPSDWRPDRTIRDDSEYEDSIARFFLGAEAILPKAYLWSWDKSEPLVKTNEVESVEEAIRQHDENREEIVIKVFSEDDLIDNLIKTYLNKNSKFKIALSERERKKLKEMYNEYLEREGTCKVNKEILPNSILSVEKRDEYLFFKFAKDCVKEVKKKISENIDKDVEDAVKSLIDIISVKPEIESIAAGTYDEVDHSNCEKLKKTIDTYDEDLGAWISYLKDLAEENKIGKCYKIGYERKDILSWKKAQSDSKKYEENGEYDEAIKSYMLYLVSRSNQRYRLEAKPALNKLFASWLEQKKDEVQKQKNEFQYSKAKKILERFKKELEKVSEKAFDKNTYRKLEKVFDDKKFNVLKRDYEYFWENCKVYIDKEIKDLEQAKKQQDKNVEHPYIKEGISFVVVGAAVVAGGVAGFHLAAENKYSKYKQKEHNAEEAVANGISGEDYLGAAQELRKEANIFRALEIASGIIGGGLLVTGVILTAISRPKKNKALLFNNFYVSADEDSFYTSLSFEF